MQRLWADADAPAALAPHGGDDALDPPQFTSGDMASTTWEQLALRVGSAPGYVYCHQGCCEHALYVADARRVHASDPRARSAYPLQTFQACSRLQCCNSCLSCVHSLICHGFGLALRSLDTRKRKAGGVW